MSIITAYKSDADGKLFEDKKQYQAHLRKLAAERRLLKKIADAEREFYQFNTHMGQVSRISELSKFIKDNWPTFWINGLKNYPWRLADKDKNMHECVDIKFENIRWVDKLSNSHSCPRNGVTNWGNMNKNFPTSYPGWYGNIIIRVRPLVRKIRGKEVLTDGWGSAYFDGTIICTGGGGGGRSQKTDYVEYEYEVYLWADDFPGLVLSREQAIAWEQIGGEPSQDQRILINTTY
jgi:hypothetical protein